MRNIAVILARGGSKRIPRKNIRDFEGLPLLIHSVASALESKLFETIIVSTDDDEIEVVVQKHGIKTLRRSGRNSSDEATTSDALLEVLKFWETVKFDNVCCLYPNPLINPLKIIEAYELMNERNFDSVFPVVKYGHPIQRSLQVNDSRVNQFYPINLRTPTQDLESTYHDAGQFYWCKIDRFRKSESILSDNTGSIELLETECQDLDNEIDWKMAELKYKLLNQ